MRLARIVVAAVAFSALTTAANACSTGSFVSMPREQVTELFSTLKENRDDLARIQAYGDLSCSSDQTIRTLAMQTALKKGNPPLLRGKALQDILGSMSSYLIELRLPPNPDRETQVFYERNNGALTFSNKFYDASKGCISLTVRECSNNSIYVRGDRLDLQYRNESLVGEFHLEDDNTVVGRVKRSRGSFMPAKMKLF